MQCNCECLKCNQRLVVLPGSRNKELTAAVCSLLDIQPAHVRYSRFHSGEQDIQIGSKKQTVKLRNQKVVILTSAYPSPAEGVLETGFVADAAKRSSPAHITLIFPYLPFSRDTFGDPARHDVHDWRRTPRVPLLHAELTADVMQCAGVQEIICVEAHKSQLAGLWDIPFSTVAIHALIKKVILDELKVGAKPMVMPVDIDGVKRAQRVASHAELPFTAAYIRLNGEVLTERSIDFSGRHVILIDDVIDTGKRLKDICDYLATQSVSRVSAVIIHSLITDPCILDEIPILDQIWVSDSLPVMHEKASKKEHRYSIASVLAEVIKRIAEDEDLDDMLVDD